MTELKDEHFLTSTMLKKRMAAGVFVIGTRRVILQILLTLTNVILARILLPEVFGIFGIISFLILTFGLVANFGMGPAIVQKKTQITKYELRAIFTLLIGASCLFIAFIYVLAPYINVWYKGQLGVSGIWWLRIFSFSVLLDHIATIPMHLLQRRLEFRKFTIGEILTSILTQTLTIAFVIQGWGLGGIVMGLLLGKAFAILIYYWFYPWPIGFNFSYTNIKPFLPFGLNFQTNNLVSSLNSAVVPIVVGSWTGPKAVGFINWAGGVRSAGLAPFDVVEKLIFPAAARSQEDKKFLKVLIEKMLKLSCLFSFPLLALIFALAPSLTTILYTEKWLPGLTTLYLSLIQGVFLLHCVLFTDVLFALGKSAAVRNISLFWALLQWILTVPLVAHFGFNGVPIAGIFVSATFFIPLIAVKKKVEIDFWRNVIPYFMYSIVCAIVVKYITLIINIRSIWQLIIIGSSGIAVYFVLLLIFEYKTLMEDLLKLKKLIAPSL